MAGVDRTFHDLRRTAATRLLSAGLDDSHVALLLGWEERAVTALKRKYVSRNAVTAAIIARLHPRDRGLAGEGSGS
jgi:integrase